MKKNLKFASIVVPVLGLMLAGGCGSTEEHHEEGEHMEEHHEEMEEGMEEHHEEMHEGMHGEMEEDHGDHMH